MNTEYWDNEYNFIQAKPLFLENISNNRFDNSSLC